MKVAILNPEVLKNLARLHGQFACVCYDTDDKKAEKVGERCETDGHWSGSRADHIKFRIEGVDRGTCEQMLRSEVGVEVPYAYQDNWNFSDVDSIPSDQISKNMASFRYIDKDGFKFATPLAIQRCADEHAQLLYADTMDFINARRKLIKDILIRSNESNDVATEAVNMLLPRATLSEFVIGFSPEALIRFMHKRLCVRAQEFIGTLAVEMKRAVEAVNPDFAGLFVPQCEYLLWCPEGKRSCGMNPTKEQLMRQLMQGKGDA